MKLPTNCSLSNHMYIYLNVCKQMTDVKFLMLYNNTLNHLIMSKKKLTLPRLKMLSTK